MSPPALPDPTRGPRPTFRKDAPVTDAARASSGELLFGEDEIIVSKTDPKGRITYVNRVFVDVSGFRAVNSSGSHTA